MRNALYNAGYFLRETKTLIKLNAVSKVFSLLSTGLIFFLLAMVISGWWISNQVIEAIQKEAEISVYYKEDMSSAEVAKLVEGFKNIEGVKEIQVVNEEEAYNRMADILGKEARVLEYFDGNPFSPFVEVKISMEQIDAVLSKLNAVEGIEHIRDNREILERMQAISGMLKLLGALIITAVAITTLVIIAHIIRLGIYNNREQINTMRLLGAPEGFIAIPFLLEGLVITLGGGLLASGLSVFMINYLYARMTGPLPFIPLPEQEALLLGTILLVMSLSVFLGVFGGMFGLSASRKA